jgi:hypothetical protein
MDKKYTSFCIDNDPVDQPTPKMVLGEYIRNLKLSVGDELYMVHDFGKKFTIKEMRENGDIVLSNPSISKDKVCRETSPLFKKVGDIPMDSQEFFFHQLDVDCSVDSDGSIKIHDKYFINYLDQFKNYFSLMRKSLDLNNQYKITYMYETIFNEMGVGVFNEYIRSNYVNYIGKDKKIEDLLSSGYEYGLEFYDNRFVCSMVSHALRMDTSDIFDNGVRAIVFGEGLKIDFSKVRF